MTDLEKLKECFTAIGIEFKVGNYTDGPEARREWTWLEIEGSGYSGFYHVFDFDPAGTFVDHGGWE